MKPTKTQFLYFIETVILWLQLARCCKSWSPVIDGYLWFLVILELSSSGEKILWSLKIDKYRDVNRQKRGKNNLFI